MIMKLLQGMVAIASLTSVSALFAAEPQASVSEAPESGFAEQAPGALVAGEIMAIAYSGFREGQYPDRGEGAVNPSAEEILEDLQILAAHNFRLIRLYDAGENSLLTLELIRKHELPIKVLLGAWLSAEVSNHEGCPWLDEPIPDEVLAANTLGNAAEVERAINLARDFDEIVVAVNVGNEALVNWNDHMVTVENVIAYVKQVQNAIEQPVTVAENYVWWRDDGAELAATVDFLGVHTYPVWEEKTIDEGMSYTIENLQGVRDALPEKPIAILEAGWATIAIEFGARASEAHQTRYYRELRDWATDKNVTVFWFEAFDEPWKGDPDSLDGAEKHWGLFNVDRTPKRVVGELLVDPANARAD
jgi:exo-beta-1,3-glucanase (GH17 family)